MRGWALAWAAWSMAVATVAQAQAPSLAVPTDPRPPAYVYALRADVAQAWQRELALQVDVAPHPAHALWGMVGWAFSEGGGPLLGAGYRARPLARGLEGPALGVDLGVRATAPGGARRTALEVGAEVGYDWVFRGLSLGLALGVVLRHPVGGAGQGGLEVGPRVGVRVGQAFR